MTVAIRFASCLCAAALATLLVVGANAAAAADQSPAADLEASQLVAAAFDHLRGDASISTVEMTIHRPQWERRMVIDAWTRGTSESMFRIVAPPKDSGNGTLKKGREMWTYNPKINRVIKLPPSMMSQAWMGSDFSNNDLAKSDSLLVDYEHRLTRTEEVNGRRHYHITAIPHPEAPVVWGMLRLIIRDDFIMLREEFFDEDHVSVKVLTLEEIAPLGGRPYPRVWRMRKTGDTERFTLVRYRKLVFRDHLPDRFFRVAGFKSEGR